MNDFTQCEEMSMTGYGGKLTCRPRAATSAALAMLLILLLAGCSEKALDLPEPGAPRPNVEPKAGYVTTTRLILPAKTVQRRRIEM